MRCGLLIYGDLETVSGGYLYDRMLVHHLRAAGHKVNLISLPWRSYPRHLADNLHRQLEQELCRMPVDVLLQDELNHPSLAWINQRLRRQVHYPIITIVHHLRSDEHHAPALLPFYRRVERRYLRHVDGYIFNSHTTRDAVESLLGSTPDGVVVPPAGDHRDPPDNDHVTACRAAMCADDGPLQILFVGNVIERKGLHTVLAALARLPRSTWRLDVVGSLDVAPAYVREIRRQIARDGLRQSVKLAGSVSETQLRGYLARNHLFVLPSFEGFGIVYLEAMSFGLPVIGSTMGAAHEIITHGQEGYLSEPDDIASLAAHLSRLHQNRDLLLQMSHAARRRYERHPSWQRSMQRLTEWLEERITIHGGTV